MKFGIGYGYWQSEWNCDYIETARKTAALGFDILEIGANHLHDMTDEEIAELKALGVELGLEYTTNSGPSRDCDLSSADPAIRENGIRFFETVIEKMAKLGSKSLIGALYSFWPSDFSVTDKEAAWERSIECLKKVAVTAEKYDIECALEVLNRNETYILTTCEEAIEYCDRIGSDHIKILIDTYHANIEEDNMYDAIRLAGDRLGHVHVGESNRKLPGMTNSIDWPAFGKALRDIHYDKAIVMEPFLKRGGAIGYDIRVWRDLSGGATEEDMDRMAAASLVYLKSCCAGVQ
ncbi:MAG: sugar phosphate isomerase/epimerase [Firmicutes bacterium]|nr:sugar phosphate isomerase/epimerase [Bacillota bacterium]